jgi:hypothetical protein
MNHLPNKLFFYVLVGFFFPVLLIWIFTSFFAPGASPHVLPSPSASLSISQNVPPFHAITLGSGGAYGTADDVKTYPPHCVGKTTTPAATLAYLGSGFSLTDISPTYRTVKADTMCYDRWTWQKGSTDMYPASTFLKIVGWPSNFFVQHKGITLLIAPVAGPNPAPKPPTPTPTTATPVQDDTQPHNSCDWVPDLVVAHPHIDICAFFTQIMSATLVQPLKTAFITVQKQVNGFLWSTPPADTYQNTHFQYFWNLSIWLVNVYLVVVVAWVAFRGMIGKTFSWLSYADVLEYIPRIGFGLLAAYLSGHLIQIIVDGSNALSLVFSHTLFSSLANGNPTDMIGLVLDGVYLLMGLLLVLEEGARYTILFVIIAFLPLLLFTAAMKETQNIAKGAIRGLIFFTFLQPAQMGVMAIGQTVIVSIFHGGTGNILSYLVSIGIMIFVLAMFFSCARLAFGGFGAPFAAAASGFAGLAAGASLRGAVQGGRGVMAGRDLVNRGADKMIEGMPKLAYRAPGAAASAYTAVRSAPEKAVSAYNTVRSAPGNTLQHIRGSNAYQTFDDAYQRMLGRPATRITPKEQARDTFLRQQRDTLKNNQGNSKRP